MAKKNTRLPKTVQATAFVLLLTCAPQVFAQNAPPGENRAPEAGAAPAPASRSQAPSTGAESTSPPAGAGGLTVGRVPGHTGQVSTVEEKRDPVVEETEKEVSRRIKSICRGC
jgi:hypothetical protein